MINYWFAFYFSDIIEVSVQFQLPASKGLFCTEKNYVLLVLRLLNVGLMNT